MGLVELYKKHINEKPSGLELHNFFEKFNIGIYVPHYNEDIRKIQEKLERDKYKEAEEWVLNNSKL